VSLSLPCVSAACTYLLSLVVGRRDGYRGSSRRRLFSMHKNSAKFEFLSLIFPLLGAKLKF